MAKPVDIPVHTPPAITPAPTDPRPLPVSGPEAPRPQLRPVDTGGVEQALGQTRAALGTQQGPVAGDPPDDASVAPWRKDMVPLNDPCAKFVDDAAPHLPADERRPTGRQIRDNGQRLADLDDVRGKVIVLLTDVDREIDECRVRMSYQTGIVVRSIRARLSDPLGDADAQKEIGRLAGPILSSVDTKNEVSTAKKRIRKQERDRAAQAQAEGIVPAVLRELELKVMRGEKLTMEDLQATRTARAPVGPAVSPAPAKRPRRPRR